MAASFDDNKDLVDSDTIAARTVILSVNTKAFKRQNKKHQLESRNALALGEDMYEPTYHGDLYQDLVYEAMALSLINTTDPVRIAEACFVLKQEAPSYFWEAMMETQEKRLYNTRMALHQKQEFNTLISGLAPQ